MVSISRFLTRVWFYFRMGYSVYLTFALGALNTLVVVWYLAIQNAPGLQNLFGHFVNFAVFTIVVGVPLSVGIGWLHYKRTSAFASEVDIQTEANPYNYKLTPGKEQDVWAPLNLEVLLSLRRLLQAQNLLDDEERLRIESLERKIQTLLGGGIAGTPRRH